MQIESWRLNRFSVHLTATYILILVDFKSPVKGLQPQSIHPLKSAVDEAFVTPGDVYRCIIDGCAWLTGNVKLNISDPKSEAWGTPARETRTDDLADPYRQV